MKNILYLGNADKELKRGHGLMIKMHHEMISSLNNITLYSFFTEGKKNDETEICIENKGKLNKLISVLHGYPPFLSVKLVRKLFEIIDTKKIDIVYIDTSVCGKIIKQIKKKYPSISCIAYFPDIEKVWMEQKKESSTFLNKIMFDLMIKNEDDTARYADVSIVLNSRDKNLFKQCYGKEPEYVIPIAVPEQNGNLTNSIHVAGDTIQLLFVGAIYKPNIDGIEWFISEVVPLITVPFQLTIIGFQMEKHKSKWEAMDKRVSVIGTVESFSSYYNSADVVIAPISEGGGMKVKTAEAFSFGKILVGLPESLEGYWDESPEFLKNNGIYRCTDAVTFADLINQLQRKEFSRSDSRIKKWIEDTYSYNSVKKRYAEVFKDC